MFTERTSVGLDVHARSVAAAAIDGVTGEVSQTRLTPSHEDIRSWISRRSSMSGCRLNRAGHRDQRATRIRWPHPATTAQ